ncbi:amidase [candidate division KSB1 bacterium]|nr:amidase [candidate division KSB1 bacterium]
MKEKQNFSIKRRDFLRSTALGSAFALSCSGLLNCDKQESVSRKQTDITLEEVDIAGLRRGMESGQISAVSLVEMYLSRIREIDKSGPAINSVIELNPDAMEIAAALDAERRDHKIRGTLHGIPVMLKDNIDTADKMSTSAGSLALVNNHPLKDAFVARKLRQAGAIIIAKTNLSEWANFRSTRSTSGWSGRGGQTKNPYVLDRNPCGSSSGSAAAVSANLCAVALGTETDGSVVCPSHVNGIVGIKPTLGLVSRSGIIPIAHSQDTAGPMARTVTDAAILLGAMTGPDPEDAVTTGNNVNSFMDYTPFLDPNGLRGARIGVARNFFGFHDRVDKVMQEAITVMKQNGAVIVDPADIETAGQFDDSEWEVLLYEFRADLNAYLARTGPEVTTRTLKELIEFNENNRESEMPCFGQEIFILAEEKSNLRDKNYLTALAKNHRLSRVEGIDATMNKHNLDAVIAPAGSPAWLTDCVNGDHYMGGSSSPAAVAGYPNITVPAGEVFGLPVGISFFGRAFSEPVLLKIAYAFEQLTRFRRPPQFLPTLDLRV